MASNARIPELVIVFPHPRQDRSESVELDPARVREAPEDADVEEDEALAVTNLCPHAEQNFAMAGKDIPHSSQNLVAAVEELEEVVPEVVTGVITVDVGLAVLLLLEAPLLAVAVEDPPLNMENDTYLAPVFSASLMAS